MHITVECPRCRTRYQLDPSLRGQHMRCPLSTCRAIFEVKALSDSAASAPASSSSQSSTGSVGDMVPILNAEQAAKPGQGSDNVSDVVPVLNAELAGGPPPTAESGTWQQGAPPRRSAAASLKKSTPPPPAPVPLTPPPAPPPGRATETTDTADWRSAPPPRARPGSDRVDVPSPLKPATQPPAVPPSAASTAKQGETVEVNDWRNAPPPSSRSGSDVRPTTPPAKRPPSSPSTPRLETPQPPANAPRVLGPGMYDAPPPVRRGVGDSLPDVAAQGPTADKTQPTNTTARRRNVWIMGGVIIAVLAILGVGGYYTLAIIAQSEGGMRREASKLYDEGRFSAAAMKYRQLREKYPDSANAEEDTFMLELSDLRAQVEGVGLKPDEALERAKTFLDTHGDKPALKSRSKDFGTSMVKLATSIAGIVKREGKPADKKVLEKATQTLNDVESRLPEAFSGQELPEANQAIKQAAVVLDERIERQKLLDALKERVANVNADAVCEARRIVRQQMEKEADFDKDPQVAELMSKLYDAHVQSVTYTSADKPLDRPNIGEDAEPSLLVDHLLDGFPAPGKVGDPVTLALARGVLYGLSQTDGEIVWAMRVGIDTATLPVRLPAAGTRPEMVLALSADTETVTALNAATGDVLWKYRLSAPCLGRPVVVDMRAYLPTYDGLVHEIELARGQLLGRYNLGQRLSVGGARQEGTKLVYFPGDDYCVYVLDVANHKCQTILYTEHRSGSLRSAPILTGPGPRFQGEVLDPNGPQGYLILSQTSGLEELELRAYGLPPQGAAATPLNLPTAPRMRGWPWFPPHADGEKLLLASDAGVVGLFGIRQMRNQDAALFPLLPSELRLSGADSGYTGRAQVVHMHEDDFWVLSRGALHRLRMTIHAAAGRTVLPVWGEPIPLGSPLHASQTDAPGSTLFLVTQPLARQGVLASAVESDTGKVRWMRQLGLICQETPVVLGQHVLAQGQSGAVFSFAPKDHPAQSDLQWQVGGENLAKPLDNNPAFRPILQRSADGTTVYQISCPGPGTHLVVRRFTSNGPIVTHGPKDEKRIELTAAPAGEPAVNSTAILLPLDDGTILRAKLTGEGSVSGPEWRPGRSRPELRCHVAWVDEETFVATDGSRGISLWSWPMGKGFKPLPAEREPEVATRTLRARIVSPPVALPGEKVRVMVADADGGLTLLEGSELTESRRWDLGGKVTSGPFVRGESVGCVVDHRRLVWIDSAKAEKLWEHKAKEDIVGQPELIDGMLVVADQSGHFVGLDPATGKPRGPGYTMKATTAPATTPVAFGSGRAFAPLTDGTVLMLSLRQLGHPFDGFPPAW